MSQEVHTPEVACTLTEEQATDRSDAVQDRLVSHYRGYDDTEDGLTVRFEGTDETLRAVARFVSNELECCSFAEYGITVAPPYEETVLTVTGPDGTRQMFHDGFVDTLVSASDTRSA